MTPQRSASAIAAALVVLLLATGSAAAQQSKFQTSQETGGAPGRYRVEVELRPGDDLIAVSSQLAATYGARIEPYAEEGFTGFAIMATPARAELMSRDPRVIAIGDLNMPAPRVVETPAPAERHTPVAAEARMQFTSEAVPGLGTYSYDGSGNVTSIGDHVFRYDAFERLQKAVLGGFGTRTYRYDRYGNILEMLTDDVSVSRMSVDPATNQIDLPYNSTTDPNMIAVYDAAGNLVSHDEDQFVYDALNMMKETTDPARRLHVYTASDERVVVLTAVSGVETTSEWTLRDVGNRVLRRLRKDAAGTWYWKEDYIYGGARLLAAEVSEPERVRHFHVDHLGTPRLITGNGGVQLAEKTYEPFGWKVSPVTPDFEQLEFTGHERDVPTLDYMHARYYKPDMGRFTSVDPKERRSATAKPQEWNLYAYALNNPVKHVDPDGRDALMFNDQASGRSVLVIPVQFTGTGATPAKIAAITRRLQRVNTGGTGVSIRVVSTNEPVHGVLNRMNLSPNYDFNNYPSAGEGTNAVGGNTAHINTAEGASTAAAAHDILHFAGLTDKYQEGPRDAGGNRTSTPLPGYSPQNVMADRNGTQLKPEQVEEARQNSTTLQCTVAVGQTQCQ
jgi:RHS repeat-associated protein